MFGTVERLIMGSYFLAHSCCEGPMSEGKTVLIGIHKYKLENISLGHSKRFYLFALWRQGALTVLLMRQL